MDNRLKNICLITILHPIITQRQPKRQPQKQKPPKRRRIGAFFKKRWSRQDYENLLECLLGEGFITRRQYLPEFLPGDVVVLARLPKFAKKCTQASFQGTASSPLRFPPSGSNQRLEIRCLLTGANMKFSTALSIKAT